MASAPGLGLEGARYLASLGVVAVGADTWALEVLPSEDATIAIPPVHPELLAKNGIYILENMDTRALAADNANEVPLCFRHASICRRGTSGNQPRCDPLGETHLLSNQRPLENSPTPRVGCREVWKSRTSKTPTPATA